MASVVTDWSIQAGLVAVTVAPAMGLPVSASTTRPTTCPVMLCAEASPAKERRDRGQQETDPVRVDHGEPLSDHGDGSWRLVSADGRGEWRQAPAGLSRRCRTENHHAPIQARRSRERSHLEGIYLRRREFLTLGAAGAIGLAASAFPMPALAGPDDPVGEVLPVAEEGRHGRRREAHALEVGHHVQQLLRVRHRQGRSGPACRRPAHPPLDARGGRRGEAAADPGASRRSASSPRWRSGSTASAASRPGRWWCPGGIPSRRW